MPFVSFGLRPGTHRYLYRVALLGGSDAGGSDAGGGDAGGGGGGGGGEADGSSALRFGATALGTSLAALHAFSLLSSHAALRVERDAAARLGGAASAPERWMGRQCPPRALRCLLLFLGAEDTSCRRFVRDAIIREMLRPTSDGVGAIATVFRRDALCLTVCPAPEKVRSCLLLFFCLFYILLFVCSSILLIVARLLA
jgi:hypothetical protein